MRISSLDLIWEYRLRTAGLVSNLHLLQGHAKMYNTKTLKFGRRVEYQRLRPCEVNELEVSLITVKFVTPKLPDNIMTLRDVHFADLTQRYKLAVAGDIIGFMMDEIWSQFIA